MKLADFDFDLPEALIATRPARPRSAARLLVAEGDAIRDLRVADLPDVFRPGDRLVLNDTKVIPARLNGVRHRPGVDGEGVARIEASAPPCLPMGVRAESQMNTGFTGARRPQPCVARGIGRSRRANAHRRAPCPGGPPARATAAPA